ncbi:MAG: hypothetical protein ACOZB3_08535, partial [Calditrichota bacterium]
TTGYANSRTPEVGHDIDSGNRPFRAGSGYAVGIRVDVEPPHRPLMFGPSFLFWNNVTGDPDPNANANYFQIELGGRISSRTRTNPSLYAGVGAGYTLSHGEVVAKLDGSKQTFDGDFPSASVHFGFKSKNDSGLSLLGEGSFHFGLGEPRGRLAVGPAKAWLIQIGVGFDLLLSHGR